MMGRSLLVLWLAVLVSGCLGGEGGDDAGGGAVTPKGAGQAWASWTPIVSESRGCGGPCMGEYSIGPEFDWVGVDAEGRVLRVEYALGLQPGVHLMDPSLEPWNRTVTAIFAAGDEYAQESGAGVRVFAVQARQLDASDWARIRVVLGTATAGLEPLGPPDGSGCNDCDVPVLKAGGLRAETLGNVPDGSGWVLLGQQMYEISAWILPEAS